MEGAATAAAPTAMVALGLGGRRAGRGQRQGRRGGQSQFAHWFLQLTRSSLRLHIMINASNGCASAGESSVLGRYDRLGARGLGAVDLAGVEHGAGPVMHLHM